MCGCYNSTELPDTPKGELKANTTLAELRGLWRGESIRIDEPLVVGGYVTSSDKAGNFYRTFTLEDATGGAEVMAGMRDLHSNYPIGCHICIRLDGCAIGVERGVLQIGLMPESFSNYIVDYFYSKVLLDRHIARSGDMVEITPRTLAIADLNEALCGRLVRVEGLRLVTEADASSKENLTPETNDEIVQSVAWRGYHPFEDSDGNRFYTYTSDYADFADKVIPDGVCNITGILQYGKVTGVDGECFILKIRDKNDCETTANNSL